MTRWRIWILVAAMLVAACGPSVEEGASGEEVYVQICARCHAENLSGGLGPPLVGVDSPALEKPEEFLTQTVTSGLGRMPSFGGALSEEQIQRVVAYVLEQQGR